MESMPSYAPGERGIDAINRVLASLTYYQTRKFLKQHAATYPRFLYKYRKLENDEDLNHLREIVVLSHLWLSSPTNFNDPFDMSTKFLFEATLEEKRTRIRKVLQDQGRKFHEIERLVPELIRNTHKAEHQAIARDNIRRTISNAGVCSFAGDPRNILMWSHYGSNHEGLCLVFEIARDAKTFLNALPVDYSVEYPVVNWFKDADKYPLTIALRKHRGWKYELERRIVKLRRANTKITFLPAALRAIITGCRVKDGSVDKLRTLLAERATRHLPTITIYECSQHESRYKLRLFKSPRL